MLAVAAVLIAAPAEAADPLKVVVTIKPVHALVAAVMRGVGEPVLLVDGQASPHSFAMKPSGARAVQQADILVRVAADVEPFTVRLVDTLPPRVKVVTLIDTPGVRVLERRTGATFEPHVHEHGHDHDHDHESAHDHEHGSRDGHVWLDPANARAIVANVAATLAERDPGHAAAYAANAAEATRLIQAMEQEIAAMLAPVKARPFVVFHDATQYFEQRFGLSAAGALTVSPEVPPGARRLTAIRRRIGGSGAVCVFAEPQLQSKVIASAIEGTAAKQGVLDPEAIMLAPGPDLYGQLMRGLAVSFRDCLGSGG